MRYWLAIVFIVLTSCTLQKPEKIEFGKDSCHHCKMTISDYRFGGELVTSKGKTYKFDSLDCMQNYQHKHPEKYKKYVSDAIHNGELIEASEAHFIIDENLRSPMGGLGIMASRDIKQLKKKSQQTDQKNLKYSDIEKLIERENSK